MLLLSSMRRWGWLVGLAALALYASACEPCYGTEVGTTTLRAELRQAGTNALTAELTAEDDNAPVGLPWWAGTIEDAAAAQAGSARVNVAATGRSLSLVIPFPVTVGQIIPLAAEPQAQNGENFAVDLGRGTPPVRTAVGAWLTSVTTCTREDPAPCVAQREQIFDGAVEVVATAPLRMRIDATVSYPAGNPLPPQAIAADLTFSVSHGTRCRD